MRRCDHQHRAAFSSHIGFCLLRSVKVCHNRRPFLVGHLTDSTHLLQTFEASGGVAAQFLHRSAIVQIALALNLQERGALQAGFSFEDAERIACRNALNLARVAAEDQAGLRALHQGQSFCHLPRRHHSRFVQDDDFAFQMGLHLLILQHPLDGYGLAKPYFL